MYFHIIKKENRTGPERRSDTEPASRSRIWHGSGGHAGPGLEILQISDIGKAEGMEIDERIKGKTGLAGLIGNPLEHSISPQLHNTLSGFLGIDLVYIPVRAEKNELEDVVRGLKAMKFIGFNVTIPYKQDIIRYLDGVSEEARLIGAVNTVRNIDGKLYGYNTDAVGFLRSYKEGAGAGLKDKKVLMLGAGGAARAIAVSAAMEGAGGIYIANRTQKRAKELVEVLNTSFGPVAQMRQYREVTTMNELTAFDAIINTTSVGMYPETGASPVGESVRLKDGQVVYDIIYNPVKTSLLETAEKYGCKTINGLGMLLYQGIAAYELWTGVRVPETVAHELFRMFSGYMESRNH